MIIFLDANICLDLLDTTRKTSKKSIQWYMKNKDNLDNNFYFSADFITIFYYVLTQKRKINPMLTLNSIEALSNEIEPCYLTNSDFIVAKEQFKKKIIGDFEDLFILNSANRIGAKQFITNDKELLRLKKFDNIDIIQV